MTAPETSDTDYCMALVREAASDRYLATLLAPQQYRESLWALYAFDAEIARIRSAVSEPALGEIRCKWWQDQIDRIYTGGTSDHPVLQGLSRAIRDFDLPRHAFINLIEARKFDLYDDPMPSLNDLEGYLGETSSVLMQMAMRVLAGDDAYELTEITGSAGITFGLTRLMCELPIHRARGQCFMPGDLLAKYDVTSAQFLVGRAEQGIEVMLSQLRHHARVRLQEARQSVSRVPVKALAAVWPASLSELYLKRLGRAGYNPLKQVADVSQFRRQARLMRLSLTESF